MSWLTKFELNPISGLFANAQKLLDEPEAKKRQKFSGVWLEVNQAWEVP